MCIMLTRNVFVIRRKIVAQPAYQEGNYVEAIQQAFLEVDQDMLNGMVLLFVYLFLNLLYLQRSYCRRQLQ